MYKKILIITILLISLFIVFSANVNATSFTNDCSDNTSATLEMYTGARPLLTNGGYNYTAPATSTRCGLFVTHVAPLNFSYEADFTINKMPDDGVNEIMGFSFQYSTNSMIAFRIGQTNWVIDCGGAANNTIAHSMIEGNTYHIKIIRNIITKPEDTYYVYKLYTNDTLVGEFNTTTFKFYGPDAHVAAGSVTTKVGSYACSFNIDNVEYDDEGAINVNVLTDVYFNLNDITHNVAMTNGIVNISIYNTNSSTWNNITNAPNTFTFPYWSMDELQVYASANGYVNISQNYIIDNTVLESEGNAYHYGGFSEGYLNEYYGYATVGFTEYVNDTNYKIFGYTRDNTGVIIPNLPIYLKNHNTSAIIDYAISGNGNNAGWYALSIPQTNNTAYYDIIINYPSYGNLTPKIYANGLDTHKTMIVYPDDLDDEFGYAADTSYDLLLNLAYTPTVTPTPSAIPYTPPSGYFAINGYVKDIDDNSINIASIPIQINYGNNTYLTSSISNVNGQYVLLIPNNLAAQIMSIKVGNKSGYLNNTVGTTYVNYPDAWNLNPTITMNFYLKKDNTVADYAIYGYVTDNSSIHRNIGNALISLKYSNGTVISTTTSNANGYYYINIPAYAISQYYNESVGVAFFNLSYNASGYYNKEYAFLYPDYFINSGNHVSFNVDLIPTYDIPEMTRYMITCYDNNNNTRISGINVKILNATNNTVMYSGYTDSSGFIQFDVPIGTYRIQTYHANYIDNDYYHNGSSGGVIQIEFPMVYYVAPTAIPTPTPTPSANPYTSVAGILYDLFVKLGVEAKYIPEAISAGIIIFFAAIGGTLIQKWEIILAFAFFGFLICVYAGFLPFWLLVVVILFLAAIIAYKYGGGL